MDGAARDRVGARDGDAHRGRNVGVGWCQRVGAAILSRSQLRAWQAWLPSERAGRLAAGSGRYLLSGVVVCPCGARRLGRTVGAQQPVYVCRDRGGRRRTDHARCGRANVVVTDLDARVWQWVMDRLTRPRARQWLSRQAEPVATPQPSTALVERARSLVVAEYRAAIADGFDAATARA